MPPFQKYPPLKTWTEQERQELFTLLQKTPKWNVDSLAKTLNKSVVEVIDEITIYEYHLSQLREGFPELLMEEEEFPEASEVADEEIELEESFSEKYNDKLDEFLQTLNYQRKFTKAENEILKLYHKEKVTKIFSWCVMLAPDTEKL
jgi:hypothetical protein